MMNKDSKSLSLDDIYLDAFDVKIPSFQICSGEHWGVVGNNGGGKSELARLLADPDCCKCTFQCVGYVSLKLESELLEREIREDDTDFLDRIDTGRSVRELITEVNQLSPSCVNELAETLGLLNLLDRGFRVLSTGERRRLMLARALAISPDLLILDDPFDGLDQEFREHLKNVLIELSKKVSLVIVSNRLPELEGLVSHLAGVFSGECVFQGRFEEGARSEELQQLLGLDTTPRELPEALDRGGAVSSFPHLVTMNDVTVSHDSRDILSAFSWRIERGQNWKISGPNGCGKSTLVNLISGDHPQCYSNDVTVFGMRRGEGESIWDVKKHIGIVSPSLHQQYRVNDVAINVVISGFFDSVGVYSQVSAEQLEVAGQWLTLIGMNSLRNQPLRSFGFGQQRLLLIARALVKRPLLLILDEPCQGLDEMNRVLVLSVIDKIAQTGATQIIYITHTPEDRLECVTHELTYKDGEWLQSNSEASLMAHQ